jgi:hypothetical protein
MDSPIPPSVCQLIPYQAADGSVWIANPVTGRGLQLTTGGGGGGAPTGGVPEAPVDGNLYGRENAAWTEVPPASDPNAVQKSGDTMTGTLLFNGDQFDSTIAGSPIAAIALQSSQNGPSGFDLGQFGGLELTGTRKHLIIPTPGGGIDLFTADNSRLSIVTDGGAYSIQWVSSGGPGVSLTIDTATGSLVVSSSTVGNGILLENGADGSQSRLHLDPGGSGDLIVTGVAGANAGKSVNLTFGKWA